MSLVVHFAGLLVRWRSDYWRVVVIFHSDHKTYNCQKNGTGKYKTYTERVLVGCTLYMPRQDVTLKSIVNNDHLV